MAVDLYTKLSEERKEQQELGLLPMWYSTGGWQMYKSKYLFEAPHWKAQATRIAKTAAKHSSDPDYWQPKFFDLLWKGWLSPSTPILANMGTHRGLPVACSGCYVEDSVSGFYEAVTEIAVLSKWGFGTSAYLGDIRPRGSIIANGGKASGVVPIIKNLVQVCRDISQGMSRRGSGGWYLDIEGGDFWEVLGMLESTPDDLNIGWNITDKFIAKLDTGDVEAVNRFQSAMKVKMTIGKGYFFFVDKANRQRPATYKDHGLDIKASNLCVTGDQRVVSDRGMLTAKELYDQGGDLTLFDNEKVVEASPMRLIEKDAKVYRVTLENGLDHTITSYHKIKTNSGMKECKDVKVGEKVAFQTKTGIFGDKDMRGEAFLLGLYQSEGTQHKDTIFLDLWEDNFDIIPEVEKAFSEFCIKYDTQLGVNGRRYHIPKFKSMTICESSSTRKIPKVRLGSKALKKGMNFEKGYIPQWIYESNEASQWEYIRGLFICDGTANISNGKGNPLYLSITNTGREYLQELQRLLLNLGVRFSLSMSHEEGERKLPDAKGGYAMYHCKATYRLVCGNRSGGLLFEKNTGFLTRKGQYVEDRVYRDNTKKFSKVKSIEYIGKEDVYCTTVDSDEHLWVCNGFITSNCSEIMLNSSEDLTYTCVLSSMNVALYDEWKDTDAVFTSTVFLDCVASEFIEKAKDIKHLHKAVNFTEKGRALGLGQMGVFSLFQKRRLDPEGFEAHSLNVEVASYIHKESEKATRWMAVEWGESEWCVGYGRRNTHLQAIAPTKSTALLMGGWSEGSSPDPAMVFSSSGAAGDIDRVNPVLLEWIKGEGLNLSKCISDVLIDNGSVQDVEWLPDDLKIVFKNAFEISQFTLIRLAAARQNFVDQGQSTNLFFAHNDDEGYIAKVHQEAFKNENILSLYYVYSNSELKAERTDDCEACQ